MKIILACLLFMTLISCAKEENTNIKKVSSEEIESMITYAGQEYVTTIGSQNSIGPFEDHRSFIGGPGGRVQFGNLDYSFPTDGRQYIARLFRNPDGTEFMKISRYPEGAGKP